MADISVREYIRWLPDEASEPTSTIVLTSPQRRFVDIRVNIDPNNADNHDNINIDTTDLSRLDWAIAGTSESTSTPPDTTGDRHWHSKWHHWIDSRVADTNLATVSDEGDMFPQPPDGTRVLEKGRMPNPSTGIETDYEEMWLSEKIDVNVPRYSQFTPNLPRSVKSSDEETVKRCAVLQLEDTSTKTRGMIVRLGQYCQGILRVGEDVVVERWKWESGASGTGGAWTRQVRIGEIEGAGASTELPVDLMSGFVHSVEVGDAVIDGNGVWKLVEWADL
ncbi:hypothetical protein B0H66DRAFT_640060 [Apodospora peruviana]|uniref:Protein HRI1 n=1 Tax=Apodospora peruviana TaxID=516989 RepID=A0AAE0M4G3_9PEZI|nr:hypothetical protein B0H66DRAFT_640060 [Apodospora peruviana]